MTNERRPGDWQRRDLRQNANELVGQNPQPWYKQTFWIIFFLIVFWPLGMVLAWRSEWSVVAKVLASAFVVATVYFSWTMSQAVLQM